jgi:hypothetical protein
MTEDLPHPRLRVRSPNRLCHVKRLEVVVVLRLLVRRLVVGGPGGLLNFARCGAHSALCCAHPLLHSAPIACVSLQEEETQRATQAKELEKKEEQEEKTKKKKKRKQQEEKTQGTTVEYDEHERYEKHQEENEGTKHRKNQEKQKEKYKQEWRKKEEKNVY